MEDTQIRNVSSDHDEIIKISTKLDILHAAVEGANNDIKQRITALGENKVEKETFHQWEISHQKEINLREEAIKKTIDENRVDISIIQKAQAKITKQFTYVAGALFTFGIILSILGPIISAAIMHALRIN